MTSLLRRWLPKPPPTPAVLLPSDRFFVVRVELDPAVEARPQVELALEAASPFPATQMLFGLVRGADGRSALAYAAHKRRFTAEETASWPASSPVVPEFLALLGHRPEGEGIVTHTAEGRTVALAWRAGESLPAAVLSLAAADGTPAQAAAEVASQAELAAGAVVAHLASPLAGRLGDEGLDLVSGEGRLYRIAPRSLDEADVRDAAFLEKRRGQAAWESRTWLVARLAAACLLFAALADIGSFLLRSHTADLTTRLAATRPKVQELDGLQSLAAKVAELGDNRPLTFEMLAIVNTKHPATLTFQGVSCKGGPILEIEGRTTSPEDAGNFEQALRAETALVAKVETRDLRAREGSTTFTLTVTFKADALRKAAQPQ